MSQLLVRLSQQVVLLQSLLQLAYLEQPQLPPQEQLLLGYQHSL
jgi:hypothetical protein